MLEESEHPADEELTRGSMDIPVVASPPGQGCQAIPRLYLVLLRDRGPKIFSSPPELA